MVSCSRCQCFSEHIIAWCLHSRAKPVQQNLKIFFSSITLLLFFRHHAVQGSLFHVADEHKSSSSSKGSFMIPTRYLYNRRQVHPYLGFLNALLDISLRSFVLDNVVRNVSKDLSRGSNAVAIAVASGKYPVWLWVSAIWGSISIFLLELLGWALLWFEWLHPEETLLPPVLMSRVGQ